MSTSNSFKFGELPAGIDASLLTGLSVTPEYSINRLVEFFSELPGCTKGATTITATEVHKLIEKAYRDNEEVTFNIPAGHPIEVTFRVIDGVIIPTHDDNVPLVGNAPIDQHTLFTVYKQLKRSIAISYAFVGEHQTADEAEAIEEFNTIVKEAISRHFD